MFGPHDVEVAEQNVVFTGAEVVDVRGGAVLPLGEEAYQLSDLVNALLEE